MSPLTAVYLWPLLSWCSPRGSRGFMASKLARNSRSTVTTWHARCGWLVSLKNKTETLRGQGAAEGEEEEPVGLRARRSNALQHRGQPPEVKTSFWLVGWFLHHQISCTLTSVCTMLTASRVLSHLAWDNFMGSHVPVAARPWWWRRWGGRWRRSQSSKIKEGSSGTHLKRSQKQTTDGQKTHEAKRREVKG